MTFGITFGARVHAAMRARGPLCAGIDPHAALLLEWGLDDSVAGLERFALAATEALAAECAVVKPQSAFYERFGSRGVAVLERVIATAREAGALVLLDVKRGDIGSTSEAYAEAYLDPASPIAADAITVSPFLGFGSLDPFVDAARKHDAGLFVLARTSNKEAPEVQAARTDDGRSVTGTSSTTCAGSTPAPSRSVRSARSSARPWGRPARTSWSTARCWPPGTAPRAARRPTCRGSSVLPCPPCCPAPRASCSVPVPTPPPCARPRGVRTTSCARCSREGGGAVREGWFGTSSGE